MNRALIQILKAVGAIVLLGIVAVFAVSPFIARSKERVRRTYCMGCLSSLGKASVMYAMDHDGQFPSTWHDLAQEYANAPKLFDCLSNLNPPGEIAAVDEWSDFSLVPGLTTNDPPDTVLAFEPLENHRGRGANVLFLNTQVRWVTPAEHKELMKHIGRHQSGGR